LLAKAPENSHLCNPKTNRELRKTDSAKLSGAMKSGRKAARKNKKNFLPDSKKILTFAVPKRAG